MLEALIFASTNPQYDNRLLIESPVQYMKIPSSEHVVYTNCFFLFWYSEQFMYTTCSELGIFMYWTGDSMNNLLSYCGLIEVRISASEENLPVIDFCLFHFLNFFNRFMLRSLRPVWLNPRLVLDALCTQFSSIILQCVRKMNKGHFWRFHRP